jgi:hypothetical protein
MKSLVMVLGTVLSLTTASRADAQAKVCIANIGTSPSGEITLIPPCLIVAPIPFSFSKDDYDIYRRMMNAESNILMFENTKTLSPKDKHDTEKTLIAESVKLFKEQRTLFCTHHPEMSVFNLSLIEDGPEVTETYPEACKK